MAVNTLFWRREFQDAVDVQLLFFLYSAVDGYSPGPRLEILGQVCRFFLLCRKLVVVVVMGHILHRRDLFIDGERALLNSLNLFARECAGCRTQ